MTQDKKRFDRNLHYFSTTEVPKSRWFANWRTKIFKAPAQFFVDRNIHPDALTITSFLTILFLFFPLFYVKQYLLAFIVLIIHISIDGLDGPVARLGGHDSEKGALSDMINDISGLMVIGVTAIHFGFIHATWGAIYLITYLYMILFIIMRNLVGVPFLFVFRTKYFFYGFLFLKVQWDMQILDWFIIIIAIYQAFAATVGFLIFRRNLPDWLAKVKLSDE